MRSADKQDVHCDGFPRRATSIAVKWLRGLAGGWQQFLRGGGLHGGTGLDHGARAQCMWQPEAWYSEQPSLGWRQAGILGAGPQTSGLEVPPPGQVAELPYRCLGTSFAQPRCPRRGSGRGGRGGREQRFTLWAVPRDPCWDLVPFWTLCVQMQGEPLWTKGSPTSWGATGRHPWAPDPFP